MTIEFQKHIWRIFTHKKGLILNSDASKYLEDFLISKFNEHSHDFTGEEYIVEVDTILNYIVTSYLPCKNENSLIVTKESIEDHIQALIRSSMNESNGYFHVVDFLKASSWKFDDSGKITRVPKPFISLNDASKKISMFRDRFSLIQQRLLRHSLFTAKVNSGQSSQFKLSSIESLEGSSETKYLLGILTLMRENEYFLEDLFSVVKLDLSRTIYSNGFFTETSIVLVEGIYSEGVFKVLSMGHPPSESKFETLSAYPHFNFFDLPSDFLDISNLLEIEKSHLNENTSLIIFSDVWLDVPDVITRLKSVLENFEQKCSLVSVPEVFVFCGSFVSHPISVAGNGNNLKFYKAPDLWDNFAEILLKHPTICSNAKFVFVPGPNDPTNLGILPSFPIPSQFVKLFSTKIPNSFFCANPCRLIYFSKQIVIFREDLMHKFCRNSILNTPKSKLPKNLLSTLIDQASLLPFSLSVCPRYWSHEHIFKLYPAPDLLVLADSENSFEENYLSVCCGNPGSFSQNNFCFQAYFPLKNTLETYN